MDIEVVRGDLQQVRKAEPTPAELGESEARVRVDRFALTSNNITYGVFGDMLGYWDFFPAEPPAEGDDTTWGRIPVWGFGTVVESRSADLAVGEQLYGYFPMSDELVITVGRADERGVSDTAPRRAGLAAAYNRYVRCAADPLHRDDRESHQMVLFPLFFTSFVIDDFLADNDDFGAQQVIVSSASAKTSIGVAFLAHQRGFRVVGLTSPGNLAFVEGLGVYDDVVTYDAVAESAVVPSVFVDVAGDADVRRAVHTRFGGELTYSMAVGGTHWAVEATVTDEPLPGPEPAFFFAPTQIAKRTQDWGRDELDARTGAAWDAFATWVDGWIDFRRAAGPDAVSEVYLGLLAGRVDPRVGFVCAMDPAAG